MHIEDHMISFSIAPSAMANFDQMAWGEVGVRGEGKER